PPHAVRQATPLKAVAERIDAAAPIRSTFDDLAFEPYRTPAQPVPTILTSTNVARGAPRPAPPVPGRPQPITTTEFDARFDPTATTRPRRPVTIRDMEFWP